MKKIISAVVLCAFTLTACANTTQTEPVMLQSSADLQSSTESSASSSTAESSAPSESSEPAPMFENADQCKAYGLYCVEDGAMLVQGNADQRIAPASITKLLTASVALKYLDAEEIVTVGTELELVHFNSSLCYIQPGQRLRVYDLLTGLLLPSGNDAAYTVAVNVARRVSGWDNMTDEDAVRYFCTLMNDLARDVGAVDSHFADPDGWDDDAHYTTVADLMKIASHALSVPEIRQIVSTPRATVVFASGEIADWMNGNRLIHAESRYYCKNAIGMKTGATDNAGLCLMAAFEKDGRTYITAVMGCEENEVRYDLTLELFNSADKLR